MPAMMRARHEVFGVCDVPDNDFYRDNGWQPVDPGTPTTEEERRAAAFAEYEKATGRRPRATRKSSES